MVARLNILLRQANSGILSNCCHCLHKVNVLVVHQELENIAAPAATKTMIILLLRVNRKRRGLLIVKWTEPGKVFAGLF